MHCYEGFSKLAKCQAAGTVMVHYTAAITAQAVIALLTQVWELISNIMPGAGEKCLTKVMRHSECSKH